MNSVDPTSKDKQTVPAPGTQSNNNNTTGSPPSGPISWTTYKRPTSPTIQVQQNFLASKPIVIESNNSSPPSVQNLSISPPNALAKSISLPSPSSSGSITPEGEATLNLTVDIESYQELQCERSVSGCFDVRLTIKELLQIVAKKVNLHLDHENEYQMLFFPNDISAESGPPTPGDPSALVRGNKNYIVMDKNRTVYYYGIEDKDRLIIRKESEGSFHSSFKSKIDLSKRFIESDGKHLIGVNGKRGERGIIFLEQQSSHLDKVSKLILSNNQLRLLPNHLVDALTNLKSLHLDSNRLQQFPEQVCSLVKLEELRMSDNHIETLPPTIGNLQHLKKLYLDKNRLDDLPEEITTLTLLKVLSLEDNNIKKLPYKLGARVDRLKVIDVGGNPMISPPMFICMKGTQAIMKYLNGMDYTLRSQIHQVQKFPFKYKVSFSTGAKDIASEDETGKSTMRRPRALNVRHDFRLNRQDSIFFNSKHVMFFFVEYGTYASIDPSAVAPMVIQPFEIMGYISASKEENEQFPQLAFFSIFDGYGGNRAAEYCKNNLHLNLTSLATTSIKPKEAPVTGPLLARKGSMMTSPSSSSSRFNLSNTEKASIENSLNFPQLLELAYKNTDEEFLQVASLEHLNSTGASACSVMIVDNELIIANVGNARAVLIRGTELFKLTTEQMSSNTDGSAPFSRAIGFLEQKDKDGAVTSIPAIKSEIINPRDQYLLLLSFGVWNTLSDNKIYEIVTKSSNCAEASRKLVDAATSKGARSGCSAVVVKLCWYLDSKPIDKRSMTYPAKSDKQMTRTSTDAGLEDKFEKKLEQKLLAVKGGEMSEDDTEDYSDDEDSFESQESTNNNKQEKKLVTSNSGSSLSPRWTPASAHPQPSPVKAFLRSASNLSTSPSMDNISSLGGDSHPDSQQE